MIADRMRALLEGQGFHHGTVRQWKNGRHMKQGRDWERVRSGRSMPLASKMPAVSAVSSGSIPAGPYGGVFEDPSDFSRQAVPTRDMSAAIINAVAGRDVYSGVSEKKQPTLPSSAEFYKSVGDYDVYSHRDLFYWVKAKTKEVVQVSLQKRDPWLIKRTVFQQIFGPAAEGATSDLQTRMQMLLTSTD